jgi:hypothetical protein
MSDNLDKPLETAKQRAERVWSNYDLMRRFLDDRKKAEDALPVPKEPAIGELINNDGKPDGRTKAVKLERKWAKDFREMMESHKRRNILLYRLSLVLQLRRLKFEKLKRLEALAAHKAQYAGALQKKDLFQ